MEFLTVSLFQRLCLSRDYASLTQFNFCLFLILVFFYFLIFRSWQRIFISAYNEKGKTGAVLHPESFQRILEPVAVTNRLVSTEHLSIYLDVENGCRSVLQMAVKAAERLAGT
jgi:hypothetical protein